MRFALYESRQGRRGAAGRGLKTDLPTCLPPLLPPADAAHLAPLSDPAAYIDIWEALARGEHPPLEQARDGGRAGCCCC